MASTPGLPGRTIGEIMVCLKKNLRGKHVLLPVGKRVES